MKSIDMTNVKEAGEFTTLPAGAYLCKIVDVLDVPDKEYLFVWFDIGAGEFAGYYEDMRTNHPDWNNVGRYVKSYKPKALPMFKRFCSAVSKSNGNFVFDGGAVNADERTLIGKKIGLVLGEEEYYSNAGELKTRLYVARECPLDQLATQKIPALKPLDDADKLDGFVNIPVTTTKSEVPFLT